MEQHQAPLTWKKLREIEQQEIEKIANLILIQQETREPQYYQTTFDLVKLPTGQRTGTYYQRKSYALIKAKEIYNKYNK